MTQSTARTISGTATARERPRRGQVIGRCAWLVPSSSAAVNPTIQQIEVATARVRVTANNCRALRTTGGGSALSRGRRPGGDNARMASRSCTASDMPTPPVSRGGVVDPMNQLAYLNSGSAFRASLVPPGRTIFLSIIFRLVKGTTTYFVPRPRKPPTDRTA